MVVGLCYGDPSIESIRIDWGPLVQVKHCVLGPMTTIKRYNVKQKRVLIYVQTDVQPTSSKPCSTLCES